MLHGRNQTKKEYILNESHSTKFYKRQRNQTSSLLRMGRVGLGGGGGVGSKHSQVGFPGGLPRWASQVGPVVKNLLVNAGDVSDAGLILGREDQ